MRTCVLIGLLLPAIANADMPMRDTEIAVQSGVELGGTSTAGGAIIGFTWGERMSKRGWFDTQVRFVMGARNGACDAVMCDHDMLSGFASEAFGGLRQYIHSGNVADYWVRLSLGGRYTEFAADDVQGFSLLGRGDVGVRLRTGDYAWDISVTFFAGPGWFSDVGSERQIGGGANLSLGFSL